MDLSPARARRQLTALAHTQADGVAPTTSSPASRAARAQWRRSAVLVLFGPSPTPAQSAADTTELLLVERSPDLMHHPGQVAFPGGGWEPEDRSLVDTALREAKEETRVSPDAVEILGQRSSLPLPNSGNLVTPVLAWWREPTVPLADGAETVDAFTVPVACLTDPDHRYTAVLRRGDNTHRGPMFLLPDAGRGRRLLWGFTAFVLSGLLDDLGWATPWDEERLWQI